MEIDGLHSQVSDPEVARLIDDILDAALALKARLADSNMDSNSIGGILISPKSHPRFWYFRVVHSGDGNYWGCWSFNEI
jgi:hypothetical protein